MLSKFKALSIIKQLHLFWTIFIIVITFVVLIPLLMIYDNSNVAVINSDIIHSMNKKNISLEERLSSDISLSIMLSETYDFTKAINDYVSADKIEQIYISNKIKDLFEPYWISNSEISKIVIYLENEALHSIWDNNVNFSNISTLYEYEWFHNSGDTSYMIDYIEPTSKDLPKNSMLLCVPIIHAQTKLGYLGLYIDKSVLFRDCIEADEDVQDIYVVDKDNNIVLSDNAKNNSMDLYQLLNLPKQKISNGSIIKTRSGVIFKSESNNQNWSIIKKYSYSDIYNIRKLYLPLLIIIILIMGCISYIFSKIQASTIATPIIKLSDGMKKMTKLSTSYNNEIKYMCDKYNSMLDLHEELLSKEKEHITKEKDALLKAAIAQINPHFLYNTLNSIGLKAYDINAYDICSLISKLGALCHSSYNISSMVSTLSKELETISLYMDLQKECSNSSFTYKINVSPETEQLIVPKFILQPLVENSILHGFNGLDKKYRININAYTNDTKLIIDVIDNGQGIPEHILQELENGRSHSLKYGIHNISQRINLLYGNDYGLSFESTLHHGTKITITLPIDKGDTDNDNLTLN